ncbi:type VI secretion system lipoprotein TssJ [Pseudomonas ficuserectae]|jgi:type VI secretion system protein VasD|uniref:Type VI secretion system lipoprotein TssJ n=7 Tax=Pseudomonas syringae group TaxID=136849 RepID=A0A6B2B740_PSESX|nr:MULTISPECIES: type VI secretion system lipoprotein TssJ [Pseudomonas]ARA83539.1 type VI secretion system-associated lipoprotein [Pseudomonas amygdali pv. lachrymans]AXH58680.1 type VI secretion system lipoprotein TssJ [Pseudomonas amygdali pv. lachrymans str. M301315]EGH04193.1 putative lipoprotein [Pseudomonas amygdali pv. aesculi str. 0893_23]KKY57761.1 lipoprotein [Pseudomonas amygdali pv. lachrymans]KMY01900.1 lipoprotein [Pseudomonas syringae KCTC 12500]
MGRYLGVLIMLLGLTACGITDRVGKRVDDTWAGDMLFSSDEKIVLTVDGGNQLNPNTSGMPLSVVTRVYQLTSLDKFNSADSNTLLDHPEQVLGNTVLDTRELVVLPGMGQVQTWPLAKEARYIAVAAFFRDDSGGRWKMAFNADAFRKDGILFSSEGGRVLLDVNRISAERGQDVLQMPEEQIIAPLQPAQPEHTEPGLMERMQSKAAESAEDAANNSIKKSLSNTFDSALEGAK